MIDRIIEKQLSEKIFKNKAIITISFLYYFITKNKNRKQTSQISIQFSDLVVSFTKKFGIKELQPKINI